MNFQKPSLTIATPAKSQIHSKFALSLLSATSQLSKHFNVMIDILPGKSNIIHARSIMLSKWYDNSRDEDLFLFIDSDHVFTANDIIKLTNEPNCDVTCGIYVSAAGVPNCYPVDRENFDKDNRAYYCATGFMLIRKDICKRMHQWMKANDKIDRVNIDANNENAVPFFRTRFANNPYPEVKQDCPDWLGEDYSFCWLVRQAGGTIRALQLETMGHEVLNIKYFNGNQVRTDGETSNTAKTIGQIGGGGLGGGNAMASIQQNSNNVHGAKRDIPDWMHGKNGTMQKLLVSETPGKKWPVKSIVYFCGFSFVTFGPNTKKLGGAEKGVINIAREWVKMGYSVYVFGNVFEGIYDGVQYMTSNKFNINDMFSNLILWRGFGLPALYKAKARNILIDFHDLSQLESYPPFIFNKINRAMVKSKFHTTVLKNIPKDKFTIVCNGMEEKMLKLCRMSHSKKAHAKRDLYRFCYTSCYTRGIDNILMYVWPAIKMKYPKAELHMYYGMNLVDDERRKPLEHLINSSEGVFDHGKVDFEEVCKERMRSTFHLYVTEWPEIDCLSIRESCMCGCIPIITSDSVYGERKGVHIPGKIGPEFFSKTIKKISELIDNPQELAKERQNINYQEVFWPDIAKKWEKLGNLSE